MSIKTKIIATLGPASNSPATITRLVEAGARIFPLNFSHGDAAQFVDVIAAIRETEKRCGFAVTIMQDLAGPKIRIGVFEEGSITVARGDKVLLGAARPAGNNLPFIPFDHEAILKTLEIGDKMILADGTLQFRVVEAGPDGIFVLEAANAGIVTSRKGLALPEKSMPIPALTEKDKKNLRDGLALGVDAVALSFVQTAQDILDARAIMALAGRTVPIVAKLERQNAVNNLEEILRETDIVMVARGDLGIECPLPMLPAMQKRIIMACNNASKPVIVATQMLLSMVNNPVPTRAETTDVANAVLDGADCLMLSEETAMGNFPVEAVRFMSEIAMQAEKLLPDVKKTSPTPRGKSATHLLAHAAYTLAEDIDAVAFVTHSQSGFSARTISACRPRQPIYAISPYAQTLHGLNFSWGVIPSATPEEAGGHLETTEQFIETSPLFKTGDALVVTAGQRRCGSCKNDVVGTNLIKVFTK